MCKPCGTIGQYAPWVVSNDIYWPPPVRLFGYKVGDVVAFRRDHVFRREATITEFITYPDWGFRVMDSEGLEFAIQIQNIIVARSAQFALSLGEM